MPAASNPNPITPAITPESSASLQARLPKVRGRYSALAPLAKVTWFQVGGPAEILFKPADQADLVDFIRDLAVDIPFFVLGVGSNLLVRDGGFAGVVIRLGGEFAAISHDADGIITAGAGCLDGNLARYAQDQGLAGLEFYSGIPGTIGGALRMNAGAYEGETANCLLDADILTRDGKVLTLTAAEIGYRYRHCSLPEDWIFLRGRFKSKPGDPAAIAAAMDKIQQSRKESQPIRSKTGGSTFKNPPGAKAWQLIDAAGCRGMEFGDAQISPMHCNFIINRGQATAQQIEWLGEAVRRRVAQRSNIDLQWEIKRVGLAVTPPTEEQQP